MKIDCHETSSVSRPPTRGSDRRAGDAGRGPRPRRAAPRRRCTARQQLERRADRGAPPTACTQRAAISTPIDRREAAAEAAAREEHEPGGRNRPRPAPRRGVRRRHRGEREHEVERDQHPGDRRDRDVELAVDVGQREDDHRGVGEHHAHRRAERDAGCPRITGRHRGRV